MVNGTSWLRRQRAFDGMAPFLWAAGIFLFLGLLAFLLEVQSPSWTQWHGIKVHGVTRNGLTYYTYRGEQHAIDNRLAPAVGGPTPTTVWLSRSDPTDDTKAYIENGYDRWLDFAVVTVWFFAATVAVVAGFARRAVRRRRRIVSMGSFGAGISDEAVRRYLARQREAVQQPGWTPDE